MLIFFNQSLQITFWNEKSKTHFSIITKKSITLQPFKLGSWKLIFKNFNTCWTSLLKLLLLAFFNQSLQITSWNKKSKTYLVSDKNFYLSSLFMSLLFYVNTSINEQVSQKKELFSIVIWVDIKSIKIAQKHVII